MPAAPIALNLVIAAPSSVSSTRLDPGVDRQRDRRAARGRIAQPVVEHPLHAGDAVAVEVGPAEDVAGQRGLRIEPLGLAAEHDRRLAERVHRRDQLGHGAAAQIDEGLAASVSIA